MLIGGNISLELVDITDNTVKLFIVTTIDIAIRY